MRIGSQLSGVDLATQHNLLQAVSRLNESNVRLATARRINRALDDPAGLIAVETLRAELTAIEEAGRLSDLADGAAASLASGNLAEAIDILDAAQREVLDARARAGAFEKQTLDSTQHVLGRMEENINSSVSMIQDTDFALETSRRVQAEILVDVATSTVAIASQRHPLIGGLIGRS